MAEKDVTVTIEQVLADPAWLAHRYDPEYDAIHFVRLERQHHRDVPFLTEQHLGASQTPVVIARADLRTWTRPAPGRLHFLFHSAFCCSTLIARAFDHPGLAMGLKEPTILNDLVGRQRRTGRPCPPDVLADVLSLLARPFGPNEMVLVKPSNVVNGLAPAIMQVLPDAHALFLYAPLRSFLISVAKKGLWGRLWVRELLLGMLQDGHQAALGFNDAQLFGQTDLQIAAIGWLSQHAAFSRLIAELGPSRMRSLDSEALLADSKDAMRRMASLFRIQASDAQIEALAGSSAFRRHSKLDEAFDAETRAAEYRDAAGAHADEIDKVEAWALQVAHTNGIAMTPPAALLG